MEMEIEMEGFFSEGYGVIPKKLMRMKISFGAKALMAYLLSVTGGDSEDEWPSIETISTDMVMSRVNVHKYLNELETAQVIKNLILIGE